MFNFRQLVAGVNIKRFTSLDALQHELLKAIRKHKSSLPAGFGTRELLAMARSQDWVREKSPKDFEILI